MRLPRFSDPADAPAADAPAAYALRRLILRDYLAVERTRLANERTLLAYVRTTLGMGAGAVTLLHFFATPAARLTGTLLLTFGVLALAFGVWRYAAVRRHIRDYALLPAPDEADAAHDAAADGAP